MAVLQAGQEVQAFRDDKEPVPRQAHQGERRKVDHSRAQGLEQAEASPCQLDPGQGEATGTFNRTSKV